MANQRLLKHIGEYRTQLIAKMKENFASLGQNLVEFEINQIQIVNQKAEWTQEVEPLIKMYNVRKEDIKNCFKLTEVAKSLSPKTLEREFMDNVATYVSLLEQNLAEQSESLRSEEMDVSEVEKMVTVVHANFQSGQEMGLGSQPGRQRKRSMLPARGKELPAFMNPRKSMDFMVQGGMDIRNERSSPAQRIRNLQGSKSPTSKLIGQYNSVNVPQNFAVPDSVYNRGLNQSSFLAPLKGDIYLPDTPTYSEMDGFPSKGMNIIQKTPFKGVVYANNREMSPSAGMPRRFAVEDEDDMNLLQSGLFDNPRKNLGMKLANKSSNPNFPPVMSGGNTNSALNSFYQNEGREPIPQMSSLREGVGPGAQRFHTPNKIASTTKLGVNVRERTPERGQGRMESENGRASSTIGTSGVSANNRNVTPKKVVKARTPDKQPKRNIFEQEPLRSLMKSLDSDTLHTFTLRNANVTDDHVFEICARMQHKTVLRVLDLSFNTITDAGLTRICETIPKTNIMTLLMSNNRITNEGLKTCFGMIRAPGNRVSSIAIDPCQIEKTAEGRKQIIDAFAKKGVTLKF